MSPVTVGAFSPKAVQRSNEGQVKSVQRELFWCTRYWAEVDNLRDRDAKLREPCVFVNVATLPTV
ncbi:hypothetical protein H6F86_05395 [Phormidium sp. FACHB-592]|uniref:Transposase n=1 Tax=Stenomitos frigidus AS-A4 TaxID=2933935 RepID=A0ABV0KVR9_9CYAN|nr:hypothetical protein [Phormidium sp. FACHB-592]MBD2073327.1 hypothetical protein [Phormidium sp. FACHB-592]